MLDMLETAAVGQLIAQRKAGYSLEQALYTSPAAFEFDLQAIFGQSWLLAGFTCELPEPSGYLALSVGRAPIVITRDRDGRFRAFHNTCRHRGAQICPEGSARKTRLTCPYHQWVYELDGRLAHAGQMQAGFDAVGIRLGQIHIEVVAGAIFICLAEVPPDFSGFRAHLEPLLKHHNLHKAKLAHQNSLVEKGNWKLVMENARECYHCAAGHPELARTFPVEGHGLDGRADDRHHKSYRARIAALGLGIGPFAGPWWDIERFALKPGQLSLTMDGRFGLQKLMVEAGDGDIGSLRWAIEPHSFCHSTADITVSFSAMPTTPGETAVTCKWLVHEDAVEGVDYDIERLTQLWNITNLQDRALVENNQRGVWSPGYRPGPYCEAAESYLLRFVDWYCDTAVRFIAGSEFLSNSIQLRV